MLEGVWVLGGGGGGERGEWVGAGVPEWVKEAKVYFFIIIILFPPPPCNLQILKHFLSLFSFFFFFCFALLCFSLSLVYH